MLDRTACYDLAERIDDLLMQAGFAEDENLLPLETVVALRNASRLLNAGRADEAVAACAGIDVGSAGLQPFVSHFLRTGTFPEVPTC